MTRYEAGSRKQSMEARQRTQFVIAISNREMLTYASEGCLENMVTGNDTLTIIYPIVVKEKGTDLFFLLRIVSDAQPMDYRE